MQVENAGICPGKCSNQELEDQPGLSVLDT